MAHVGKRYPLMPGSANYWLFNVGGGSWTQGIPRMWKMVNEGTAIGSLALKWAGLTVLSTVAEVASDHQRIKWRFDHPSDPAAFVTWEITWEEWASSEVYPFENFRYRYHYFYHDTPGILAGWSNETQNSDDQWKNLTGPTLFDLNNVDWPALINPTLFRRMGTRTRWRSASWSEQEADYHPYRYGP